MLSIFIFNIFNYNILKMPVNEKVGSLMQQMPLESIFMSVLSTVANSDRQLAATTTDFLTNTCLTHEVQYGSDGKPLIDDNTNAPITKSHITTVDFNYSNGDNVEILTVPLASIINIPSLSISEVDIGFTVEINAMETNSTSSSTVKTSEMGAKFNADARYGFGAFRMNVHVEGDYRTSCTIKNKSSASDSLSTKACLDIHVKAINKQPEGLKTILNILNNTIQAKVIKSSNVSP
jgi:hypothetical protein